MESIAIKIDPALLTNPDADMRYVLPNLLSKRSGGIIWDDGYDYIGPSNLMVVFLRVTDLEQAIACITDVITRVRLFNNDLRKAVTVAIQRGERYEVIYPADSHEDFGL